MRSTLCAILLPWLFIGRVMADGSPAATRPTTPWLGVHVLVNGARDLDRLAKSVQPLAQLGVNALVIEVDYNFAFASHPELRTSDPVTLEDAKKFARVCRESRIRLIPSLNCLGHQSWAKQTGELLTRHPELDETPGKYPENRGIYCRSWCPLNPDTDRIVLPLIDELIDAFDADAFHVGMDEVFIIASPDCPRCNGKTAADVFALQVDHLHDHLVTHRKVEMLMWADRLLDAKALGFSEWEASENGTAAAIDKIPRDIVLCPWHYEARKSYGSLPFLLKKGFRVWPAGWNDLAASEKLLDYSLGLHDPRLVGYLSTTWGGARLEDLSSFAPTALAVRKWRAEAPLTKDLSR